MWHYTAAAHLWASDITAELYIQAEPFQTDPNERKDYQRTAPSSPGRIPGGSCLANPRQHLTQTG